MYNEERKVAFLKDIEDNHSNDYLDVMASIFNKAEQFENMFGKDLCDFSHEEISSMYFLLGYANQETYNTFNSNAKKYVNWCDSHMLIKDYVNHFNEFCMADFRRFVDKRLEAKKYLTYDEFENIVNGIVNARDKFLFRCLYEFGKSKNYVEITNMTKSQIDIKNRKVHLCTGRVVNVSARFIDTALDADEELTYYLRLSLLERALQPSEYIFKTMGGTREGINKEATKIISRIIKTNLDDLGGYSRISSSAIAVSGQFNMIRTRSRELGITEEEYILGHFDELRMQYIMTPNVPKTYYQKYKSYI